MVPMAPTTRTPPVAPASAAHLLAAVALALSTATGVASQELPAMVSRGGERRISAGDDSFRLSFDARTGRLAAVECGGEIALVDDPDVSSPLAFDAEAASVPSASAPWRCEGVGPGAEPDSVAISYSLGEWRGVMLWRVHPADRMLQGTLSFEWSGDAPARLHSITIHHGKVRCGGGAGRYVLAGMFPPVARDFAHFRPGRVEEGSDRTPMAVGDDGAHSVLLAHDELRPYSDYATPLVTERADGFSLSTRYESAGWIRPGEPQTVGDIWLAFRDGNAEEHLRHTGDWFRKVGMMPPADRPDWVRDIVACYSLHPCGRNDDNRCDPDGLALARSYLPFLEALGANCIWMRPIEDKIPYMPRDYFTLQPGVGTADDLAAYVAEAHSRGIRVWRDAVPHGGAADFPRALAHPEFLAWKEDGKPDAWWTYDYFAPGWISMFSDIVARLTAEAGLDGWRIDVATGSRFPNWNPAVPYARGSFARCQGALAMNRAIRAAARAVTPDAATLGETTHFSGAAVCDSIYDYRPNLLWFWRFTDTPVAKCVRDIRRHLHEIQAALPPGAVQLHYAENHDSHPSLPLFGRAGATALFAMTAFCDGYPLIYQETEDGCFEAMRDILRARRETPELLRGDADYLCVAAPDGVFAVLRTLGENASVALVNFNGRRARGEVSWPGGAFACDLPPFGWEVRRVAGDGECSQLFTNGNCAQIAHSNSNLCGSAALHGKTKYDNTVEAIPAFTVVTNENEIVVRLPGATRWFARTAEGDFESPFFVRHPRLGFVKSTVKHGTHDTAIRWSSALHPFGFTPDRACVGGVFPDGSAVTISGFDTRLAEAVVLDRVAGEPGLAIAIRADDPAGLSCEVSAGGPGGEALPSPASFTGIPELTAVMGGWEWESGGLRLAIRRNGTLRAGWLRDAASGKWRKFVGTVDIRTDTGTGWKGPFGNPDTSVCSQNDAFGDPIRFWREPDGTVHLDFGPGDLRSFGGRMAVPIWFRTRYTLRPGDSSFELESAISIERDYAAGEGEIALRVAGDEGRTYRWLTPQTTLSAPKGAWHGVRLPFGANRQPTKEKDTTQ